MLKYIYYSTILLLLLLASCGTSARMIIIEGQMSTTGWKEEDRKHKYNIDTAPETPKLITGNQSDLTKEHDNVIWEDEAYAPDPKLPKAKTNNNE